MGKVLLNNGKVKLVERINKSGFTGVYWREWAVMDNNGNALEWCDNRNKTVSYSKMAARHGLTAKDIV